MAYKDIAEQYIKSALPLLESSYQEEGRLRNHVLPVFGERLASSILPAELDVHFAKLLADGLSPSSVRKIRSVMSMTFKYAIRALRMRDLENPVKDANDVRVAKRKPTPIPLSWIEPLLSHVNRHYYPLFVTGLFTGLRKGELAGLRLRDVNFETRMILVTRSFKKDTTKAAKERMVGIHQMLVPLLQNVVTERQKAGVGMDGTLFTIEDVGQRDWKRKDGTPHGKRKKDDDWSINTNTDLPDLMRSALKAAGIVDGYRYTCRRGASRGRTGKAPRRTWGCGQVVIKQVQEETLCANCDPLAPRRMWCEPIPVKHAFKDLRSTFGTWVAKSKGNIRAATVLLGHSAVEVTEGSYALLEATDLLEDIDKLPFAFVDRQTERKVGNATPCVADASSAFLAPGGSEGPNVAALGPSTSNDFSNFGSESGGNRTHNLWIKSPQDAVQNRKSGPAGGGTGSHARANPQGSVRRVQHPVAPGSSPRTPASSAFLAPSLSVIAGGGDRLLTPDQVATALGVCRDTIYRAMKRGDLASSRFGSATIRIRASDLEAFLARSAAAPSPTPKGKR